MVRKNVTIQESKCCHADTYIAVKTFRHYSAKLKCCTTLRRCSLNVGERMKKTSAHAGSEVLGDLSATLRTSSAGLERSGAMFRPYGR
jgi:hypothetical protein